MFDIEKKMEKVQELRKDAKWSTKTSKSGKSSTTTVTFKDGGSVKF